MRWVNNKKGVIAIGGKLTVELAKTSIRRWLVELRRSGSVIEFEQKDIEDTEKNIKKQNLCLSNDSHIIALAQVSGARLLYTNDAKLKEDFKNPTLLKPRGKVYSTYRNRDLLSKNTCCERR